MTADITISAEERDALCAEILSRLTGIDDIRMAFENGDFDRAARLGIEFGDELRLMEDLGWTGSDAQKPIRLTMPAEQRNRLFMRLKASTLSFRRDQEQEQAEIENDAREQRIRAERIVQACERVLAEEPGIGGTADAD